MSDLEMELLKAEADEAAAAAKAAVYRRALGANAAPARARRGPRGPTPVRAPDREPDAVAAAKAERAVRRTPGVEEAG